MAKINPRKNYYSILGISSDASIRDIRRAHRKKVMQTHPDCNGGKERGDIRAINEAWDVLSDFELRGRYDDLRNVDSAEQRYVNEQRRREEQERQRRAEEDRKEKERRKREQEEIFEFAKQAWIKLEPYLRKFPDLNKRFMAKSFEEMHPEEKDLLGGIYKNEGILFYEDFGVFDYFLNNLNPSKEELAEILKFTMPDSKMQTTIPLKSDHILGMGLKLCFTTAYNEAIYPKTYLRIVSDNAYFPLGESYRTNWLVDPEKVNEFIPFANFCSFSLKLANGLKSGNYKIKLSQQKREEDGSARWHGYWIDDLVVGGVPIIQDRKSLVEKL